MVLTHTSENYEIDLEDCGSSAQMLDWIFQICSKAWATPQDLGDLVQALNDLLRPQATICSFGTDKKLDVKKHLTSLKTGQPQNS